MRGAEGGCLEDRACEQKEKISGERDPDHGKRGRLRVRDDPVRRLEARASVHRKDERQVNELRADVDIHERHRHEDDDGPPSAAVPPPNERGVLSKRRREENGWRRDDDEEQGGKKNTAFPAKLAERRVRSSPGVRESPRSGRDEGERTPARTRVLSASRGTKRVRERAFERGPRPIAGRLRKPCPARGAGAGDLGKLGAAERAGPGSVVVPLAQVTSSRPAGTAAGLIKIRRESADSTKGPRKKPLARASRETRGARASRVDRDEIPGRPEEAPTDMSVLRILPPPFVSIAFLLAAGPALAAPDEVRAIWITRWDFRSEADVRRSIRTAHELGLNRVFFQVRGRADAYYRSPYEPWGEEIGGRDPGFDPLAVAVDEASRRRIALEAWVNVLPAWKGSSPPRSRSHIFHTRPEWFLVNRAGKRLRLDKNRYTILNPCLPEVRSYLATVISDIAKRYRVDGIHLDYIRFVAPNGGRALDFPFDSRTLGLFRAQTGATPASSPAEWNDWRRRNVNTVLYRVAAACRAARPGVRISVASIANYHRARTTLFQDVATWQRRGWVDDVYPMNYHRRTADFERYGRNAIAAGPPGTVHLGIGVYLLDDPAQMRAQIEAARRLGSNGYALFALANFAATRSHESRAGAAAERKRAAFRRELLSTHRSRVATTRVQPPASRPEYRNVRPQNGK